MGGGWEEARPIFRLPRNGRCLLAVARRRYITNIYQRESPSGTEATASPCPFPFSLFPSFSFSFFGFPVSPSYAFIFRTKACSHPRKPNYAHFHRSLCFPFPPDFLCKKEPENAYTCDRVRALLRKSKVRAVVDGLRDKKLRAKSRRPFSVTTRRDYGKIGRRCQEPRSFTLLDLYASALWSFSAKPAPRNGHVARETPGRTQRCHRIRETEMRTPEPRGGRHFLAAD